MTVTTSPVLIIGAGPSGLTAALALAKNKVPVRIIDKAPEFHKMTRGAGLHPKTLEIFRFLGVLDDIFSFSSPLMPMQSYKLPGGTEVERSWTLLHVEPSTSDRPYTVVSVSQYLTEGVLRKHLAAHGVHVELGTEPISVEQDPEGITVTLKKTGVDGKESTETCRAAYIVGADGARGHSRKYIGATFEGETRDADGQVWAECALEGDYGFGLDHWHVWTQPGKVTISCRPKVEGGYHVGLICTGFDPVDLVDPSKYKDFFYEVTGRKDIVFKGMSTPVLWKPKMRMVNKFSEGRIFVAGDVAHVHSPTGGQGLNTSVQDSFNAAWKIALAYKGLASPDLLATYTEERVPVVAQMLGATTNLYEKIVKSVVQQDNKESGILQWRNRALTLLEVNYRFSPVVFDARGNEGRSQDEMKALAYQGYGPDGGVRAGDRAPEAPGLVDVAGNETSLFAIFRPDMHTIVLFAEEAGSERNEVMAVAEKTQSFPAGTVQTVILARQDASVVALGETKVYQDRDGLATRAYHTHGDAPKIVVVRPDGYIGAFAYDVEGVRNYFSRVFRTA